MFMLRIAQVMLALYTACTCVLAPENCAKLHSDRMLQHVGMCSRSILVRQQNRKGNPLLVTYTRSEQL